MIKYATSNPIRTIFFVGLLWRILIFCCYPAVTILPDSEGYQMLAERILAFDLSGYDGTRSPGYPAILAILGLNDMWIVVAQMLLGLWSSVVLFQVCLLCEIRKKAALVVAIGFICLLHVVFYETCVLTETLTLLVMLKVTELSLRSFSQETFRSWWTLAGLLTFLVLIKPFYVFLPFVIFGYFLLIKKSVNPFFSRSILVLLLPMLVFFGWSSVNKINTGYFVPTTYYGFNLAQNCVAFAEKAPDGYREIADIYVRHREEAQREEGFTGMAIWRAYPELVESTGLSLPDLSALLQKFSVATIKANPEAYVKQVFISWWQFWKVDIFWNKERFVSQPALSVFEKIWTVQAYAIRYSKLFFLLTVPFVILSAWIARKWTVGVFLSGMILITSVLQAVTTYGDNYRFSYPFEPLMWVVVVITLMSVSQKRGKFL